MQELVFRLSKVNKYLAMNLEKNLMGLISFIRVSCSFFVDSCGVRGQYLHMGDALS